MVALVQQPLLQPCSSAGGLATQLDTRACLAPRERRDLFVLVATASRCACHRPGRVLAAPARLRLSIRRACGAMAPRPSTTPALVTRTAFAAHVISEGMGRADYEARYREVEEAGCVGKGAFGRVYIAWRLGAQVWPGLHVLRCCLVPAGAGHCCLGANPGNPTASCAREAQTQLCSLRPVDGWAAPRWRSKSCKCGVKLMLPGRPA